MADRTLIDWLSNRKIHQILSQGRDWSKRVACLNMPQLKQGNIPIIFPHFQIPSVAKKYLKDNKHNNPPLTIKICSDICYWTLSGPRRSQVV